MLIPFPIAFFVSAFLFDLAYWKTANAMSSTASLWLHAVIPTGLVLSLIAVLILLFTGWKGWEIVYGHRVGD
jgi:uncharacterized membrane protein